MNYDLHVRFYKHNQFEEGFDEYCKNHPIDCNCKDCLINDDILMGFLK